MSIISRLLHFIRSGFRLFVCRESGMAHARRWSAGCSQHPRPVAFFTSSSSRCMMSSQYSCDTYSCDTSDLYPLCMYGTPSRARMMFISVHASHIALIADAGIAVLSIVSFINLSFGWRPGGRLWVIFPYDLRLPAIGLRRLRRRI